MLADTHVHLHARYDPDSFFDHAAANMSRAARSVEGGRGARRALLLTEAHGADAFDRLRVRPADPRTSPAAGWEVVPTDEEESVTVRRPGEEILVVAGRQIATRERLELLALGTRRRFSDGRPFDEMLAELRGLGLPAVVPWGFGKWWFERGRTVRGALEGPDGRGLLLGDNRARPRGAPTPGPMRRAAELGVPVLAGSDPLPLPGEERQVGSYGSLLRLRLDPERPATSLRGHLRSLTDSPPTFGRRAGLASSLRTQARLRLRRPRGAGS